MSNQGDIKMLESKHVKMVWAGQPRQLGHVVSTDSRRRVYTPSFTVHQQLVRRPSLDSSVVSKSKTLSLRRDSTTAVHTQPPHQIYRAHSFRDVIIRDTTQRKQRTPLPMATKLAHDSEIKPILKTGKATYALPQTDEKSSEISSQKTPVEADGKFCYKLPEKPPVKLRKTVSFKEDMPSSKKSNSLRRHFRSPVLSIPKDVLKLHHTSGQVFV